MKLLGKCNLQYANHLYSKKKTVLRSDRERGDEPYAEFFDIYSLQKLYIKISGDISSEVMRSNPRAGAKDRLDIYFFDFQLDNVINILEPYVNSLAVEFDDIPRNVTDPTGMEHPDGITLGEIYPITSLTAKCTVNYADESISILSESKLYLEAERKKGDKFHIGAQMNGGISFESKEMNCFEIWIDYSDTKRFLHAIMIAKNLLA